MEKVKLEFVHDGSVARIVLDDGKGNVIDSVMMKELNETFLSLGKMNHIRLMIIEGAGKHFSFGASVEEHKKENAAAMLRSFHGLFYRLLDLNIPSVAKISGQCLGGGLELALACNILFADKTAKLGQPEIILGVFPPPASLILPMKIGAARAEELLITGRTIGAEEGKTIGLLQEVYEDKQAMEKGLDEWIKQHILSKSASSLRFAVKAGRALFRKTLKENLPQLEEMYVKNLMETWDANEGINSFLEKRKPEWKNC